MYFIEGERNAHQFLLVLNSSREEGVLISEVRYSDKLLPILIKDGKITELSPMWGSIRKALVGGERIVEFKEWLVIQMLEHSDHGEALIDYNSTSTVVIEKGKLRFAEFQEIFFTDEKHRSTSMFKFGDQEDLRDFPTARGSKWLAAALLSSGYQTYCEDREGEGKSNDLSFEQIFSNI